MSDTYKIYGDYNTPTQTLLEEFGFVDTARSWFKVYTCLLYTSPSPRDS